MSNPTTAARQTEPDVTPPDEGPDQPSRAPQIGHRKLTGGLALDRFSGLYLAIGLAVFFVLWEPSTFGTLGNARSIAAGEAVTGLLTMAALVSLLSGMFDVSVAANMSLAISLCGWLQSVGHVNPLVAVLVTLVAGGLVGAANAFVITRLRVEPVIATLGMGSVLAAIAFWIAKGNTYLDGISHHFVKFGTARILSVPAPVLYLLAVAAILYYILEHTPLGRYLYAIGANPEAARLAGVKVVPLQWIALVMSGIIASFAGVVLTMELGAAAFGAGASYLLPAFAGAFLGATQIRPGRFNVLGTLVAIYLLAIGVKGLQLHYPGLPWIHDLFEGLALIVAVGIGARAGRARTAKIV